MNFTPWAVRRSSPIARRAARKSSASSRVLSPQRRLERDEQHPQRQVARIDRLAMVGPLPLEVLEPPAHVGGRRDADPTGDYAHAGERRSAEPLPIDRSCHRPDRDRHGGGLDEPAVEAAVRVAAEPVEVGLGVHAGQREHRRVRVHDVRRIGTHPDRDGVADLVEQVPIEVTALTGRVVAPAQHRLGPPIRPGDRFAASWRSRSSTVSRLASGDSAPGDRVRRGPRS